MIGSLLYYALYPLSRYLNGRPSEAIKKGLPPAVVNGKAAWDGGAVTTRGFSPCSGTKREMKERMKEPSPENGDNTRPDTDKEQLMAVLHEETNSEAASKMSEVKSAVNEKQTEMRNGQQQDEVGALKKEEDREITIHHEVLHMQQNTEHGGVFTTEDISPEQALGSQIECLQMEDSTQETGSSVQEKIKMPSLEEYVTLAEATMQENTCPVQEQIQIQCLEESQTPTEPHIKETTCPLQEKINIQSLEESMNPAEETECWDEYVAPAIEEVHGPGLAEELWQLPVLSYYPPIRPTLPVEVMWRVWEEIDENATEPFTNASMDFTVMSYNILAQDLLEANHELYTHCPPEVLDWSYRCRLLLNEMQKWEPDILCLQEVQENHYHEQLYPVLSQMGYICVYKRRTGTKTDGCATCYRSGRFFGVSVTTLEFFRSEMELLDRHNVGIVLLLQPVVIQASEVKAKGQPLCVANTHLLFNPRRGDVKLAQLAIMLAEIDSVVKSCKAKGEHCNLILCGDFNSVPHMPLYQLITTGELYFQGLPAWMISGQEDLSHRAYGHRLFAPLWPSCLGITDNCQYTTAKEILKSQSQKSGKGQYSHEFMLQLRFCPAACVRPQDLELIPGVTDNTPDASRGNQPYEKRFRHIISHQLDLESVYKHVLRGFGKPEVTTLQSEGGATVDYIFYTPRRILTCNQNAGGNFVSNGLKLIGALSLLSEDVLLSMRGLPNHIFPSDHLSLLAKFQLDLSAA